MDAVQKANSGHPGTAMALAPVTFKLWDKFITHNPANPDWANRDRFILSAGHASMLLYSALLVNGYEITLDDIKSFRKLHSKCAGHPEYGMLKGIETTTGPLGQGASTTVGMAIAEKWLKTRFNKPGFDIVDYRIYSILSDGDMMEGIASEAASLAGHLGLGNIIWIYDDNKITIEGTTDLAFTENVGDRFESYNWQVQTVEDANNLSDLETAITNARNENQKPSLIIVKSHIAYGSPNMQDTSESHGAPLGDEEIRLTKEFYGWPDKNFFVPDEVAEYSRERVSTGAKTEQDWNSVFDKYSKEYPELAKEFELIQKGELPGGWDSDLPVFPADEKGVPTRKANNKIMNSIGSKVGWILGGAADVGSSTNTYLSDTSSFSSNDTQGRNFHFGIREHAMAAAVNGMALSKLRPYCSTYFVFSDYLKPSLRLSALMQLPVTYIFTHDSIGLGEDGPTHQPIEQLATLRATPNVDVMRPADANELTELWKHVMTSTRTPSVLVLTRQNIPVIDRSKYNSADGALKGGYIIADSDNEPDIILISTGSEVSICIEVFEKLKIEGISSRVVSMPCFSLFDKQPQDYRDTVLPPTVNRRLSVEAGSTFGWERYVGANGQGKAFGIDRFGESAHCKDVMNEFGFNVDNIYKEAKSILSLK